MKDKLKGWEEIAEYLGIDRRTAQKYEETRGLPVHRLKGGVRPPVHAFVAELDQWQGRDRKSVPIDRGLEDQILHRIGSLSAAKNLYRKDFLVRFKLQPFKDVVLGRVAIAYDLVNGSDEKQPYTQEITIDDCERGHVEAMSVSVDGKPIYALNSPKIAEAHRGYVAYRGPTIMIEPSSRQKTYKGTASWVIRRNESDFWYLHAGIPTFGIIVETSAPPDFEITPSFSVPELLLKGEHVDITWKRRLPK